MRADIPGGVEEKTLPVSVLPRDWASYPAPEALAELGTEWARSRRSAVLIVPSAVIPGEENVLLNPEHPDFARVRIGQARPFSFDGRTWKERGK